MARHTIDGANEKLERYGLVTIVRRPGKSNRYYLNEPEVTDKMLGELRAKGYEPLIGVGSAETAPVVEF